MAESNKNQYELMYIVNAVLNEEQIKDIVGRVNKFVTEHGGEVGDVEEWGQRRLAYPIEKKRNGYYVNMYFTASGDVVTRLERAMEINDNIMRYLTLRMDSKMIRHRERTKAAAQAEAASAQEATA